MVPPTCNATNCVPNTRVTAVAVAKLLKASNIPNVLWGYSAVSLLGIDYKYPEIDIIVCRSTLKKAGNALAAAGYTRCPDATCSTKSSDGHRHLAADEHFHSDAAHLHYNNDANNTSFAGIRLYAKGRLLWWIPDSKLQWMSNRTNDALFMTASDASIPDADARSPTTSGTGRWEDIDPHPGAVRLLRPAAFYEALQLLMCLYFYDTEGRGGAFSEMWCGVLMCASNVAVVREVERNLGLEFRRLWRHDKVVRSEEERAREENFYPVLRLRNRLLTGNLRQSTYVPPLPVENREGRPQLPDLDVDPDYESTKSH
ncbi:hypothetical protein BJY00DRAFT_314701 [Aspergillus carlsbadensis]|nr:hypothetical protein BJY00DRAFT_314701 [Aspergillus carlsbadensis]